MKKKIVIHVKIESNESTTIEQRVKFLRFNFQNVAGTWRIRVR